VEKKGEGGEASWASDGVEVGQQLAGAVTAGTTPATSPGGEGTRLSSRTSEDERRRVGVGFNPTDSANWAGSDQTNWALPILTKIT
jgi:hypothetical protein